MTRVKFHPAARAELARARQWYAERNPEAAERFVDEVQRATRLIRESPARWPVVFGEARRIVLAEFPYVIVYRWNEPAGFVLLLAVAHQRRRPGYWSWR